MTIVTLHSMPFKPLLALIFAALMFSCTPEKKAQKAFKQGKYERTIALYKGVLNRQPNNPKANYFVAESYRMSNRIKDAEPYYAKTKGRGSGVSPTS